MKTPWWVPATLSLAMSANAARAGDWPRPEKSTVDPCLIACPAGEVTFRVEARNLFTVCPNSAITIDLCGCPTARFAPTFPSDHLTFFTPCQPTGYTDMAGIVTMPLRIGGVGTGPTRIYGDGILLASGTRSGHPIRTRIWSWT